MTDGRSVDTALFPAFRRTLWVRSVPGWLVPERFLLDKVRTYFGKRNSSRGGILLAKAGGVSQNVPFFSGRYAPEQFCSVPSPSTVIRKKWWTNHCLA